VFMDTLSQFFADPQLFHDSERQCRALEMAITIREAEPLYYIECRPFSQLLDAIDKNVQERFSISELSSFKHNKKGERVMSAGIREAKEHNPVMAGIFRCFEEYLDEARNALLQDGADAGSVKNLVVLKQLDAKSNRTQEELQCDLCMLVAPLCRFLYVTLSKGIYLTTSTDEFRDVHAVELLLQSIATLFLQTLPRLLFNFSTDVEDPAQFSFNNESVCLMMKSTLEMLASLMALVNYHSKYGPILLVPDARQDVIDAQNSLEQILPTQTDYSQVVKLASLDHLLFSIGKSVIPVLGEYLMQCNKFLSALYTVTNPHRTKLTQLNAALSSISMSILFFIHELLSMSYVDSSCLVYEQPSIPVDDTIGTLRNKSFKKIKNSSNPIDNEFLTKRAISKNLPNKTAPTSLRTREEVHECIISVILANKIVDQIFMFLQASEGSRPYMLALSILHILPLDRMGATHYACTVLARLCVD
ncbi:ATPase involved in DNA repair/chromosome segregation, partial [Giardia duodenalis]